MLFNLWILSTLFIIYKIEDASFISTTRFHFIISTEVRTEKNQKLSINFFVSLYGKRPSYIGSKHLKRFLPPLNVGEGESSEGEAALSPIIASHLVPSVLFDRASLNEATAVPLMLCCSHTLDGVGHIHIALYVIFLTSHFAFILLSSSSYPLFFFFLLV